MPAMGDLFAPVYQAGNQASMQAANDWQNRVFNVNSQNIEQTRKPAAFNTGNPGGMLDPEALRVLAQGGPYSFNARRNAIAAAAAPPPASTPVAAPPAAQPQQALPPGFDWFAPFNGPMPSELYGSG